MSKNFQPLSSGEVLSVNSDSQFVIGHSTFRVSEFTAALKQLMLDNGTGGLTPEKIDWLTTEGIECDVLRFGSEGWVKGKVRLHLEFAEDEDGEASPDPKTEAAIEFVAPVAATAVVGTVVAEVAAEVTPETVTTDELSFDLDSGLSDAAETAVAEETPPSNDLDFFSKETFVQKEDESFDDLFSSSDVTEEDTPETITNDTDNSFDGFFDEKVSTTDETLVDSGLGDDFDALTTESAMDSPDADDTSDSIDDLFGDDDLFGESGAETEAVVEEEIVDEAGDDFSGDSFDFDMEDDASLEAIAPEEDADDLEDMLDFGDEAATDDDDLFAELDATPEAAAEETAAENSDLDGLDDFFGEELSSETEASLGELDELDDFDGLLDEETPEATADNDDLGLDDLFDGEEAEDESVLDDPFGEAENAASSATESIDDDDFSFDLEDNAADELAFDDLETADGASDLEFSNPFADDEDTEFSLGDSLDDPFGENDSESSDGFSFDDTAAAMTDESSAELVGEELGDDLDDDLLEADLPPEIDFGSTEDLGEFINVSVLRKKAAATPPKPMDIDDELGSPFDMGDDSLLDSQDDDISLGELFANDDDDEFNFDELDSDPLDAVTGDEDEVSADIWDLE